jgi:o-succinylbenzoate synthase
MKLQYSPYSLIKKNKVNARDQSLTQKGTLIRVYESESIWGVADLCPWPELGDLTLMQEIERKGPLFQRAFQLAVEDLQARQQQKSLLQNKWVDNNVLVADYGSFNFQNSELRGHTLKIKADKQLFRLIEVLEAAPKDLVFRIDFNSVLGRDEFQLFLDNLSPTLQVEYIEDPCGYDEELWRKWNQIIPIAVDFITAEDHYSVRVVKPTREIIKGDRKTVITSAMDHPVGVAHALRWAQNVAENKSGLLTLNLYEETPFHHFFIYRQLSEINFSEKALNDFGIGMTQELLQLIWKDSL